MADLSSLLNNSGDDLKEVLVPQGTWKGTVKGGKMTKEKEDKNGRPFTQALFYLELSEPQGDVDQTELREVSVADIKEETVFYRFGPVYGRSELRRLKNLLKSLGVSTEGRTPMEWMDELKKTQPEVFAEVSHDEFEGEMRTKVGKVYATA